jgi:hypothetical protein
MLELKSRRSEDLLPTPIPTDRNLAHRAAQKAEQRTEAAETTRLAYHAAGEHIVKAMGLSRMYEAAARPGAVGVTTPRSSPAAASGKPQSPSQPDLLEGPKPARAVPLMGWAIGVLVVALLLLGLSMFLRGRRSGSLPPGGAAASRILTAAGMTPDTAASPSRS